MRYLAVDLGDKRTGLAVGDAILRVPSPAGVLEIPAARRDGADLIDALASAARTHGAAALVVGLPMNMDGTEGPRAKVVRALAARLAAQAHLPLHLQDERLSSAQADWQMARTGLTRGQKKAKRDALAAAAILKDFLDTLPSLPTVPPAPPA